MCRPATAGNWRSPRSPAGRKPHAQRAASARFKQLATRFLAWRAQRETLRLLNTVDARDLARPRHHRHRVGGLRRTRGTACAATIRTGGARGQAKSARIARRPDAVGRAKAHRAVRARPRDGGHASSRLRGDSFCPPYVTHRIRGTRNKLSPLAKSAFILSRALLARGASTGDVRMMEQAGKRGRRTGQRSRGRRGNRASACAAPARSRPRQPRHPGGFGTRPGGTTAPVRGAR